jgi:hypothetical protein
MFENNEKDMLGLQDILVDILYIVVDIICDWNAWLQSLPKKKKCIQSHLIYENEKKSIVCDLTNIKNLFNFWINYIKRLYFLLIIF